MNSGNIGNYGSNGECRDICSFENQGNHAKPENQL
jgi:hypothetical protein